MKLDIILEPDLTPTEILELGLLAERQGFRAIWTQNYSSARDALMSLIPLARESRKILVGAVIYCPYEMHPIKITNSILSLNEYADGRAMIVIGAGGEWPEVMVSKVFESSYSDRMQSVQETLEIVTAALKDQEVNYYGKHYSALRFSTQWHQGPAPLIYHGACGPKMLSMGAKIADGSMLSDVMPAMLEPRLQALRDSCKARDSAKPDYRLSNFIAWHVRRDKRESAQEARRELIIRGWLERDWLEPFLSPEETNMVLNNRWPFLEAWLKRRPVIEGVPEHIVDSLVEGLSLSGDYSDIERHTERLHEFSAAGFTEIALRIHERPDESIRLIGERVLPAF